MCFSCCFYRSYGLCDRLLWSHCFLVCFFFFKCWFGSLWFWFVFLATWLLQWVFNCCGALPSRVLMFMLWGPRKISKTQSWLAYSLLAIGYVSNLVQCSVMISLLLLWIVERFLLQVTAMLSLAAACSSAGVVVLYAKDLKYCNVHDQLSCLRYEVAVALSFVTWVQIALSSHVTFWILASV